MDNLRRLQEAFGASIRVPFDFSTGKFAMQTQRYADLAVEAVMPREAQNSRQRLSVYNEQYWFRLLNVLQQNFPLLARALTHWEFNQLATAYLSEVPSTHPSLDVLADGFPEFLRGQERWNPPRNLQLAALDSAYLRAFHAPEMPWLDPESLDPARQEALPELPLRPQPHLSLVEEDWNLAENRVKVMEDGNFVPEFREEKKYWVVYRSGVSIETRSLKPLAFRLLSQFTRFPSGQCLASACSETAEGLSGEALAEFTAGLAAWFQEWTVARWFQSPWPR